VHFVSLFFGLTFAICTRFDDTHEYHDYEQYIYILIINYKYKTKITDDRSTELYKTVNVENMKCTCVVARHL